MPSTNHLRPFVLVFSGLCLLALVLVALDEFVGWEWATKTVNVGQEVGRLFFTAVALTFVIIEGGSMVLAAWLREKELKEAVDKGRAETSALYLEAERQRLPGESLADAVARIEAERANAHP